MRQPKTSDLVAKYADKPVTRYDQFDGFLNAKEDSVMHPDEDGDVLLGGETHELMSFDSGVRVLIPDGVEPEDAARALTKIADWVERDLDFTRKRRAEDTRGDVPF
jgi:hypothetical protein